MPGAWTISSFPRCKFHVFLSHSAEDRGWLVLPLFDALQKRAIIPWIDLHHFPLGAESFEALRESILGCRHIVYLLTLATLDNPRGWTSLERAYGGLLQENLRGPGLEYCHIELPLFFLPREHETLPRTIWQPILGRGRFHTAT